MADHHQAGGAGRAQVGRRPGPRNSITLSWSIVCLLRPRPARCRSRQQGSARARCHGAGTRCLRADSARQAPAVAAAGMLSPEVDAMDGGRRRCGWRCSGRCGWSSTARRSTCRGPEAARGARAAGARRGPDRHRRPPRRRAVAVGGARSRAGRPCTPTCPGCARTSARRRPGCRPGTDGYRLELGADELDVAQARALLATARAGARRTRPARSPCCGRRTRCGAGRCSPTSPTSRRSPPRSRGARSCTAR